MYEITVTSYNVHGSSLPSLKIRSLTDYTRVNKSPGVSTPTLPNIKECWYVCVFLFKLSKSFDFNY